VIVFIGNVPSDCRESDIESFFRGVGEVRDVVVKKNYAFCEFVDYYDAKDAVKEKDGEKLLGTRVRVEFAKGEKSSGRRSSRSPDRTCVYVGGIGGDCRERDIESFFSGYGNIKQVNVKKGFAFTVFEDERDAEDAVKALSGRRLKGERVKLEFAKGERRGSDRDRYEAGAGNRVVVENLSSKTAWQDLKDYMKKAGEVLYCKAHHERQGEGMVEFYKKADMEWALDRLDGTELDGRKIKVREMGAGRSSRRDRTRSRSTRSRSRSNSRSKSRSRSRRSRSRSRS